MAYSTNIDYKAIQNALKPQIDAETDAAKKAAEVMPPMRNREQIYGQEAAELLRNITVYHCMRRDQLLRLYPGKEGVIENLLHYLVGLVEAEGVDGQIFNAAGPELLSYQQQLQKFAAHIGKRCPIIPLPFLSPRLSAWWLQFATSVPQPVAKALVGGLKHDIPADDGPLRALLPQTLLSFDEALTESLALEQRLGAATQYTGSRSFRAKTSRPGASPK